MLRGDARAQDVTGTVTVRFEQRARSGQILKCSAKTPFRATPGSPQAQAGGELTDG